MSYLTILVILALLALSSALLLGGKKNLDMARLPEECQQAALFAGNEIEGASSGVSARVLSGSTQVVSGNLYDLTVAITGPAGHCRVFNVKVNAQAWKRPPFSMFEHKLLEQPCP